MNILFPVASVILEAENGNSSNLEISNLLLAIFSLLLSLVAIIISSLSQKKANRLQERLVSIEEQREQEAKAAESRADLRAIIGKTSQGTDKLIVSNHGNSEAYNIRIELDGKPFSEHCAETSGSKLPDMIGPRSEISCLLSTHFECSPPFDLKILWDDKLGKDHVYKTSLTWN